MSMRGAIESAIRVERDGYKVLRFWNTDVARNLQGVLSVIDSTLRQSTPPVRRFAAATLPFGEG
jgi:very-short-patch-repair endonuclease